MRQEWLAARDKLLGWSYERSDYEHRQAKRGFGDNKVARALAADYAASFYGQIGAILSSAAKKDLAEVATWKIAKFLDACRREFGHDKKLIPDEGQFGLRLDYSPYLKSGQIEASIALFRNYDQDREKTIREGLAALQKTKAKKKRARQKLGT